VGRALEHEANNSSYTVAVVAAGLAAGSDFTSLLAGAVAAATSVLAGLSDVVVSVAVAAVVLAAVDSRFAA